MTLKCILRLLNQGGRNIIHIEPQILVLLTKTLSSMDLIVCQVQLTEGDQIVTLLNDFKILEIPCKYRKIPPKIFRD